MNGFIVIAIGFGILIGAFVLAYFLVAPNVDFELDLDYQSKNFSDSLKKRLRVLALILFMGLVIVVLGIIIVIFPPYSESELSNPDSTPKASLIVSLYKR